MLSKPKNTILALLKQAEQISDTKNFATNTFLDNKKIVRIISDLDQNIQAQEKALQNQDSNQFLALVEKESKLVLAFEQIEQKACAKAPMLKKSMQNLRAKVYNYAPIATILGTYALGVATEIAIDTNVVMDSGQRSIPPKHIRKVAKICFESCEGLAEFASADFGTLSIAVSTVVIAGLVTLMIKKPTRTDVNFARALA
jgi:hypothetical protein